ncbi:MAG: phosphatidate cytidylyltransferase [Bacteroidales bacterium]|nr:phosphatidate cytidylyltransferase [Bacteroidales bacterium]
MNNFFRRTLTGAWIVIFVLGGFWLHPVTFFLSGLILLAGTQLEYHQIIRGSGIRTQVIPAIVTGIFAYVLSTLCALELLAAKYMLLLIPVGGIIMVIELYRKQEKPFDSIAHTFLAVLYTALPFSLFPFAAFGQSGLQPLVSSWDIEFSPGLIIGFFILIWANDTGAYLAGITFGRNKLFERISPKKTWEGFAGGLILAALAGWLLSGWLGVTGKPEWVAMAGIVSIAGTFGDLVESMLKRSAGVKDSGTFMPGHGGFLDRFDSALIAFPPAYLFISLIG